MTTEVTEGDVMMEAEAGALHWEGRGRGHTPKSGDGHLEAAKSKNQVLPSEPPEGTSLVNAWTLAW